MEISKLGQNLEIKYWNGRYGIIAENQKLVIPYSARLTRRWRFNSLNLAEFFINKYLK